VVVPVNTFLKASEVGYYLGQSGARHAVLIDRFRNVRPPEMLASICPELATAGQGFVAGGALPDLRNIVVFNRSGSPTDGAFDYAELEAFGRDDESARAVADRMECEVRPTDLGMVKYTSGSTGFPKGVMLEQGGIVANVLLHSRRVEVDGSDVFFSMMPFFHGGGSVWGLMTMLFNGGTLVFTEAFDARLGAEQIERERCTVFFGVLAQEVVQAALDDGRDLSSVRIAHLPNDDARRVMPNATYTISPTGLTESYGPAAITSPRDPLDKQRTTSGRPLDGNEYRVVDPTTGLDVAPGETGEAWIRGNVMRGYWNKPEETARVLDGEGWLHTEDLVSIDADGYISFVGRLKLMLKVGGENVSIEEVERVVGAHDSIAECGAVGVPDRRKGEVVRVYVARRPGHDVEEDDLRTWLEARLARFKMPRDIVFVDKLARLANGKIDRVALDALAARGDVGDNDNGDNENRDVEEVAG
jgi:fatty-acyl-CoA synthase